MEISRICLDTTVLIGYLKGREPSASAVEKAVKECSSYVTTITVYELLFGVARAKKEIGEEALSGTKPIIKKKRSFLQTARSLNLQGPSDWSARFEDYLFKRENEPMDKVFLDN
jgi:predicted nucleic acid-binding protein